jgi:contactin associated protein-like 2
VLGGVVRGCPVDQTTLPVTFKTEKSFVKLTGDEGSENLNVTLDFRTYEENGLLIYHSFASEGFISVSVEEARVKVRLAAAGIPVVEIDNFDQTYNDGKWHSVELALSKNYALVFIF